jgi:iron complex transport system substrate-binding protein
MPHARCPAYALLTLLSLASVSFGCDAPKESAETSKQQTKGATDSEPDAAPESSDPRLATSETLPDDPTRIVSLAPNLTEMLYALGLGDRVVGVTKFADHPTAVEDVEHVGTFANPDFEAILAREPDFVLGPISGGKKSTVDKLDDAGVAHAFLRIDTVDDVLWGLEKVGEWTGRTEEAAELVDSIASEMETIAQRYRDRDAPRVLMVYGHEPLVGAGPGTFGHQLLDRLGAGNVLVDFDSQYPRLDLEKVLELNPTHVVDTTMNPKAASPEAFWNRHESLTAVQNGRVAHVTDEVVLRPGPRLPEALEVLGEALYGTGSDESNESSPDAGGSRP